ncbi:MAG: esterase [Gammaproteobacteria bacterium]|nr:esterase [Gammaproteobacteria bacterium]MDH5776723.1 esterase [Gammaproteobacteria bacterium]
MDSTPRRLIDVLLNPAALWSLLREYFNFSRLRRQQAITDRAGLKEFIQTRASFVAQTSLYGYLRTRAGMRYPELFDDDFFVNSINIAKWQVWLACLSDLTVYAGGLLQRHPQSDKGNIVEIMQQLLDEILQETGIPSDAGEKFSQSADHVRQRLAMTDWSAVTDDEQAFSHSPTALVEWAPVVDEYKQMDEDIVLNSVRFRWQEIRQDLRKFLDVEKVLDL